jgi:hypothetical protein
MINRLLINAKKTKKSGNEKPFSEENTLKIQKSIAFRTGVCYNIK